MKKPVLLLLRQVEHWETLAAVSIRRLWSTRRDTAARESLREWIDILRDTRRVRAYRGWPLKTSPAQH